MTNQIWGSFVHKGNADTLESPPQANPANLNGAIGALENEFLQVLSTIEQEFSSLLSDLSGGVGDAGGSPSSGGTATPGGTSSVGSPGGTGGNTYTYNVYIDDGNNDNNRSSSFNGSHDTVNSNTGHNSGHNIDTNTKVSVETGGIPLDDGG